MSAVTPGARRTWIVVALFLLCSGALLHAVPAPEIGKSEDAIQVTAASMIRWQEGQDTILDLNGGARITQGTTALAAPRLLVWFHEETRDGRRRGVVEAYARTDADVTPQGGEAQQNPRPAIFRLTTQKGVTFTAPATWAGDRPVDDEFRREAAAARKGETPRSLPKGFGSFGALRVTAETYLTSEHEKGMVLSLLGNAEVRATTKDYGDDFIVQADTIRLRIAYRNGDKKDRAPESLYAEGAVDIRRGPEHLIADSFYLDLIANTGIGRHARLRASFAQGALPVQIYADTIRQHSNDRFEVEDGGYFTLSPFAQPHYRMEATLIDAVVGPGEHRVRRAQSRTPGDGSAPADGSSPDGASNPPRVTDSIVVSSRSNTLYMGNLPVFWWPYMAKDVTSGTFLLKRAEIGSSGNLGAFLRGGWDLYDLGLYANDWSTMVLLTDWYARRGFGSGMAYDYSVPGRTGGARVYYIKDGATDDDGSLPVEKKDRGEITWRHRETLADSWRADFEVGYLSDRRYLRTYYPNEYDGGKDHETALFLTRREDNSLLTGFVRERVNDFQNTTDKETVGYHLIGQPLFNTPLAWTTHSEVGRVRGRTDDALGLQDPNGIGRLDTTHELSLPFLTGPVKIDPYVWGDLTGYTSQANDDGSSVRGASAVGLRTSTNFYRAYDTQSELFGIDRLRHVITPKAELRDTWGVSSDPSNYIQNDEIDTIDRGTYADLGVRNRWQTYRYVDGRRTMVDFLTVDVDYIRNLQGRYSFARTTQDYVQVGSIWRVTNELTLSSEDNRFNTDMGRIDALNGALALNYWKPVTLSFAQKYYRDFYDPANPEHNVSIVSAEWQPLHSRWKIAGNMSYDFLYTKQPGDSKSNMLGSALIFTRQLEQWSLVISAGFNQGLSNETTFSIMLIPPGVRRGGGAYSMVGY